VRLTPPSCHGGTLVASAVGTVMAGRAKTEQLKDAGSPDSQSYRDD
jgi:hypothetical protein